MVTLENVTKKYISKTILDDISLSFDKGKVYALLGPNGCGKTTIMKLISGLAKPSSGTILYNNKPIGTNSKADIAYMPTENYFYSYMTVKDVGKYFSTFYKDFDIEEYGCLLNKMELTPNLKVTKLSSGLSAKLRLAVTLARKAKIYLLDEPLNGIDILARDHIINTILASINADNTFIISSHILDELEKIIDNVIFINNNKIELAGSAEEVRISSNQSLTDLYKSIYSKEADF